MFIVGRCLPQQSEWSNHVNVAHYYRRGSTFTHDNLYADSCQWDCCWLTRTSRGWDGVKFKLDVCSFLSQFPRGIHAHHIVSLMITMLFVFIAVIHAHHIVCLTIAMYIQCRTRKVAQDHQYRSENFIKQHALLRFDIKILPDTPQAR